MPDTELPKSDMQLLSNVNILTFRKILLRYWVNDHAWLRAILSNFYQVDDALYRSNHPSPRRLSHLQRRGIQSVLSLRGGASNTPNILERGACARLGLDLRFIRMRTGVLAPPETLLELIEQLRTMPKPMLVHCKSGADRTGLAVTLYLHVLKNIPLDQARRALSWRYAHWKWGQAGIIHALLDTYAADHITTGVDFEKWVTSHYNPDAITAAYHGLHRAKAPSA